MNLLLEEDPAVHAGDYNTPMEKGKGKMENLLPLLCTLACPVGIGLLMWLLMRMGKEQTSSDAASTQVDRPIVVSKTTTPSSESMTSAAPSPLKAIWDCVQMCLNWKVLAGLALVAVLIGLVAPMSVKDTVEGSTGLDYGTTGQPETFFINRNGILTSHWFGPLTEDGMRRELAKLQVTLK